MRHVIDAAHWWTGAPDGNDRYYYDVFEVGPDGNVSRARKLFSRMCKARTVAEVTAHASAQLQRKG